jgi:hypothetical protein
MRAAPSDPVALGETVRREAVARADPDVEPATALPVADVADEDEGPVPLGTAAVTPPAAICDDVAPVVPDDVTTAVGDGGRS